MVVKGRVWHLLGQSDSFVVIAPSPTFCQPPPPPIQICQLHACAELTADRQRGPKVISFVLTAYQSLTLKVPRSILLEQLCKLSVQRRNQQARTHVRVGKPCKCELCLPEIYANSLLTRTETQKPAGPGWVWIHFTETEGGMFPPVCSPPLPGRDEPVSFSRLLSETRTQAQALNHSLTGLTPPHQSSPKPHRSLMSPVSPSLLHLGITQALLFHHQHLTPVLNDQYQFPFPRYLRRKTPNKVK